MLILRLGLLGLRGSSWRLCGLRGLKDASNTPEDEVIPYTDSTVHKTWKSKYGWQPKEDNSLSGTVGNYAWYGMFCAALGVVIWSCFIAEPDDPNKSWLKPIWEIDPKLERPILEQFLVDRAKSGLPVAHIRKRLEEMKAEGR